MIDNEFFMKNQVNYVVYSSPGFICIEANKSVKRSRLFYCKVVKSIESEWIFILFVLVYKLMGISSEQVIKALV